ncbi:MAG: redoxin domain-containing protein [Gemmatimonadaceae bacterium]|nr:redoxin domain-containing protein [Gemmatimonadaceae bacterium]
MRRRVLLIAIILAVPLAVAVAARIRPTHAARAETMPPALPDLGALPELSGGTQWINGAPITRESLKGHVAMIEIWTYGCYNCLNALPYIKETAARYKSAGLVTIGVHTPEFDREKVPANVERRVKELGVEFPVVMDNDFAIWRAFNNRYWPSVYIVDKRGRIRFHHDGEGRYSDIDAAVKALLLE